MKKYLILLVTMTVIVGNLKTNGQKKIPSHADLNQRVFWFGFKMGSNTSTFKLSWDINPLEQINKWDFNAGIMFEFDINKYLAIETEFLFSPKGLKVEYSYFNNYYGTVIIKQYIDALWYLEMPVNAIFKTPIGLNFGAGIYLAYAVAGTQYISFTSESDNPPQWVKEILDKQKVIENDLFSDETTTIVSNPYKRFDVGLNFMIEYQFHCGILFGARYALGTKNILDSSITDKTCKNRTLNLYIGFKF
jgi:hypothetical protein